MGTEALLLSGRRYLASRSKKRKPSEGTKEAIRRDEKGPYGSIHFVRAEVAVPAVEADHAIRPLRFQNIPARPAIAKLLSEVQISLPEMAPKSWPYLAK
jgi:hypothetical protein